LLNTFYNKFFPMSKVNECRKEISYLLKRRMRNFLRVGKDFKRC
jgi:hypothetical protein